LWYTVRRRPSEEMFNPRCTLSTTKHVGGSVTVYAASSIGIAPFLKIDGTMTGEFYRNMTLSCRGHSIIVNSEPDFQSGGTTHWT
uniref:Sushi domain-containing protein n=1 Tax=Haemonchus placei TaxID=6290 RepID=A0A0N4WGP3_HAEPC